MGVILMRVRLRVSDVLKIVIKRFVMSSNPFPVRCNHLDALNRSRKPTKMENLELRVSLSALKSFCTSTHSFPE